MSSNPCQHDRRRNTGLLLACLLGAMTFAPIRSEAQAPIAVRLDGPSSLEPGAPFVVTLAAVVPEDVLLGSFDVAVRWDPSLLGFVGVADGSFGALNPNTSNASSGRITLNSFNAQGKGGEVSLAVLSFEVAGSEEGSATIGLELVEVSAAGDFADLLPRVSVAAYSVSIAAATAAPPVAGFTADPTDGSAPLTVTFIDNSTGDIAAHAWDFGDGTMSADANPGPHVYTTAGTYTITLTVTGEDGSSSTTTSTITVTEPPAGAVVASFAAEPEGDTAPVTVTLTNSSTGDITAYAWDFGDGVTYDGAEPGMYIYPTAGSYTITLTVTGADGATSTATYAVTASEPLVEAAASFASTADGDVAPVTVTLANSSTGDIAAYAWDFGDGATSIDANPGAHVYTVAGTYTITLTVTGEDGGSSSATSTITVTEPPAGALVASFTAAPEGETVPVTVMLTNSSTGDIVAYAWDFGDGVTFDGAEPGMYIYPAAGTYTITLTVTGADGASSTATATVTASEPLVAAVASFTATADGDTAPVTVTLANTSIGDIAAHAWDFGDGATSADADPGAHLYTTAGTYTITLTVTGADGGTDEATAPVVVGEASEAAVAAFTAIADGDTAPVVVTLTNASSGDIVSYFWDFGDGTTSTLEAPGSHVYAEAGSYRIVLAVLGEDGAASQQTAAIAVLAPLESAVANFTATPNGQIAPVTVELRNLSTGDIVSNLWDFGDGATSTSADPGTYVYGEPGTYTIRLTVTGEDGSSDSQTAVVVVEEVQSSADPGDGSATLDLDLAPGNQQQLTGPGMPGSTVTMQVILGQSFTFRQLEVFLRYDPDQMRPAGISGIGINALGLLPSPELQGPGYVLVGSLVFSAVSGSGEVLLVDFELLPGYVGPAVVLLDSISLGQSTTERTALRPGARVVIGGEGGNIPPSAFIDAPAAAVRIEAGTSIQLRGRATDPEDGALSGADLRWHSSLDGDLGTGASLSSTLSAFGEHVIRFTATDSEGLSTTRTTTVTVLESIIIEPPETDAGDGSATLDFDLSPGDQRRLIDGTISPGSVVTVQVLLGRRFTQFRQVDLWLRFNPDKLTPVAARAVGIYAAATALDPLAEDSPDLVRVASAIFFGDPVSGDGEILEVDFRLNPGFVGPTGVTLEALSIGPSSTDRTQLTPGAKVVFGGEVANDPPEAFIDAPAKGTEVLAGSTITLRGRGIDPEDGSLSGESLSWSSSPQGRLGSGTSRSATLTEIGEHTITLTATDSEGETGSVSITVTVTQPNLGPTALISAPTDDATFGPGDSVALRGRGTDPEDGTLPGTQLSWHSSLQGDLGSGTFRSVTLTVVGEHTITLTATDAQGESGSASIQVTVTEPVAVEPGLMVRAQVGRLTGESPMAVPVASRIVFEVQAYTLADRSDSAIVDDYDWSVPDVLVGRIPDLGQLILTTTTGPPETIVFRRQGVSAEFVVEVVGGPVDHLLIVPGDVALEAGDAVDFDALAADRYGNEFPLKGVGLVWIVLPADLGEIHPKTGRFTASRPGEGYIIAAANWSLRFGVAEQTVQGTGKIVVTSAVPTEYALHQNHPNPFNPETEIHFDLPERAYVELTVYNVSGQRVETLLATELSAGRHTYTWDARGQPSGVYVYTLRTPGHSESRKMMLAK